MENKQAPRNYMDSDVAKYLVSELRRQYPFIQISTGGQEMFVRALETTPVLESKHFSEEPSNNQEYSARYILRTEDGEVYLRPTRIIRNKNAKDLKMNILKSAEEFIFRNKSHHPKIISRHLRRDSDIVKMMEEKSKNELKNYQLSLLMREERIEYESGEIPKEIVINRPILVVPGANIKELESIRKFEEREGKVDITIGKWPNERCQQLRLCDYIKNLS